MWLMLQQDTPDDYVVATGEQYSVRHFVEVAFREVDIPIQWVGEGIEEKGVHVETGQVLVEIDPRYFRPTEVETLLGDPTKAKAKLGWKLRHSFQELVYEMVKEDLKAAQQVDLVKREGFEVYQAHE
ncbi:GDP-mannose 4,6-dehydratase [compost metagenome]